MNSEVAQIMIAEDELSLRTILKKLLQKKGYQVETAGEGRVALKKLPPGYQNAGHDWP
jgi:CheY-like chemotaxis protein